MEDTAVDKWTTALNFFASPLWKAPGILEWK